MRKLFSFGRRMAMPAVAAMVMCSYGIAWGQQQGTAKQLHGMWTLVSFETTGKDGSKTRSPDRKGLFVFDPSGRYSYHFVRDNLPKFASNDRNKGTADENKAIVQGVLSHFGTFTVNDREGTFTMRPEASSFPNYTGVEQPARKFNISGDTLTVINPAPSVNTGINELIFRRVR